MVFDNAAPFAAIAAIRPSARDVRFLAETAAAVSAVSSATHYRNTINKHLPEAPDIGPDDGVATVKTSMEAWTVELVYPAAFFQKN